MKSKLFKLAALPLAIQSSIAATNVNVDITASEIKIDNNNTYDTQFKTDKYYYFVNNQEVFINFFSDQIILGNNTYKKLNVAESDSVKSQILNFKGNENSGKIKLSADIYTSDSAPLIKIQTVRRGTVNFSNLYFDGNNSAFNENGTCATAIEIDNQLSGISGSLNVIDQISFENVDFENFYGNSVIHFDKLQSKTLTTDELSIKNTSFNKNKATTSTAANNTGSLFTINSGNSILENLTVSNNITEDYLFSLSSKFVALTDSKIYDNKSNKGIFFDTKVHDQNKYFDRDDSLFELSNLTVWNNVVNNDNSTLTIQEYETVISSNNSFYGNTVNNGYGGALSVSATGGASVADSAYTKFSDIGSIFEGNSAEYGGALYFSGTSATLTNTSISGNTAKYGAGIYFESEAQFSNLYLNLENVSLTDNKGSDGALYLYLDNDGNYSVDLNVNISANNKDVIWQGNCDEDGNGNDIVIRFRGYDSNADANINLYSANGRSLQLSNGISTVKSANSAIGICTADINIGHMDNDTDDGADVQDSKVILGGENSFDGPVTNFTIYAGSLDLLESSRLVWVNEKTSDASTGAFLAKSGSVFNVYLNSVSSDNVSEHAGLAPIDLGGNDFTMEAGSNLNISINGVQSLRSSADQGWLIVAANAELTQGTDPKISFTDKNWLYDFSEGKNYSRA